jgi:hypothetical protein
MITASSSQSAFVFVVCGDAEYIDTLHYSLAALQRHTRADILVVTDSRRNEKEIKWSRVVDVDTPPDLDNHQASIFLKTALHRFVPPGPRYCYLDTDVVAVDPGVDRVFQFAPAPIRFAADHIGLREFSSLAVRCDCLVRHRHGLEEIAALKRLAYASVPPTESKPRLCSTPTDYEQRAAEPMTCWKMYIRWAAGRPAPGQRGVATWRRWNRFWVEHQNAVLWEPRAIVRHVERTTKWRRDKLRQSWVSPTGDDVYHIACDHLVDQIAKTFSIRVKRPAWQHWNGGVFLFSERSSAFLEAWHAKTMAIFTDPAWRTRDQGTLVATAWEFGLQNLPVLPRAFNCIVDPYIGGLMLSANGERLTLNGFLTQERPLFVHVMHRFQDPTWDVWNWVATRAKSNDEPGADNPIMSETSNAGRHG